MTEILNRFVVGQTYSTRSICDHECIFSETIKARTALYVTTVSGKRFRIFIRGTAEAFRPFGNYSMCPVLTALSPDLSQARS